MFLIPILHCIAHPLSRKDSGNDASNSPAVAVRSRSVHKNTRPAFKRLRGQLLLVLLALHGTASRADEIGDTEAAWLPPNAAVSTATADFFGAAVHTTLLDIQRGGTDLAPSMPGSVILSSGAVSDNRAVDVITGSNSIRDGAFANASGLPIVIQNTGANVLIQNATIVNVQLH